MVVNFDTFKICKEIIHSFTSCCLVQKVADKNNRLTRVYTPAHIHTGRPLRVLITCAKLNLKKMPFTTLFSYSLTLTLSLSFTYTNTPFYTLSLTLSLWMQVGEKFSPLLCGFTLFQGSNKSPTSLFIQILANV